MLKKSLLLLTAAVLAFLPTAAFSQSQCFPSLCVTSSGGGGGTGNLSGTLTAPRVPFASAANTLVDDADMTFVTDTLTVTKIIGSTSITDTGLTATRLTFAGVGGLLSDDSDLTFVTDTLTFTKGVAPTSFTTPLLEIGTAGTTDTSIARAAAGQISVEGNRVPVIAAAGSLTSGRIPFAGANNTISDDSDLTFSTDTLTATKFIGTTSITNSALTSGRVIFSGASGIQSDDSDLTFSTDTLTATKLASTIETGDLTVGSAVGAANAVDLGETAGQITFEGSTSDAIETRLAAADPTDTDKTITLPNVTGTLPVTICKSAPNQATTGTSEEVIGTCTVPANTLNADGDILQVLITGVTAANANNKTVRVRFGGIGGVILYDSTALASNNLVYTTERPIILTRISSTTMRGAGCLTTSAKGGTATVTARCWNEDTETIDPTISNTLVVTGTTPTASGDFTLNTYTVIAFK